MCSYMYIDCRRYASTKSVWAQKSSAICFFNKTQMTFLTLSLPFLLTILIRGYSCQFIAFFKLRHESLFRYLRIQFLYIEVWFANRLTWNASSVSRHRQKYFMKWQEYPCIQTKNLNWKVVKGGRSENWAKQGQEFYFQSDANPLPFHKLSEHVQTFNLVDKSSRWLRNHLSTYTPRRQKCC